MIIATTIQEVQQHVRAWKAEGLTIGLVPTMGYLHQGHKSLMARAVAECDCVVVSVFVNPTQFAPNEDLESYPRDFEADCVLAKDAGVSLIFHPDPSEMYYLNASTYIVESDVSRELCGKSRPIHFRGVCTVVAKLMNISMADHAYFGQKDAQQLAVVRRMVRDLNMNVDVVGCPIVREADGLAKSSRNSYLNTDERKAALVLSQAVMCGQKMCQDGCTDGHAITEAMRDIINSEPLARIEYVDMMSWDTIKPVDTIEGPVLVAMAVFIGNTRLIDNFIFEG